MRRHRYRQRIQVENSVVNINTMVVKKLAYDTTRIIDAYLTNVKTNKYQLKQMYFTSI